MSLGSGPDDEELEESDRALSCSSRDKTIPSPCSSDESRVLDKRGKAKEGNQCLCWFLCVFKRVRRSNPVSLVRACECVCTFLRSER